MFETICNLIPRDPHYPAARADAGYSEARAGRQTVRRPAVPVPRGAWRGRRIYPAAQPPAQCALCALPHCGGGQRFAAVQRGSFPDNRLRRPRGPRRTCRYRQGNSPQSDDDRGGDAGRHRLRRDPHARAAWAHLLRRSRYHIPDARMGSPGAGHADPGDRKVQGAGCAARFEWVRHRRHRDRLLVHAQLGHRGRDLVHAAAGWQCVRRRRR